MLLAAPASAAIPSGTEFPTVTLRELDGAYFDLSMFGGRPILVNFWATWCGPCRMELPVVQRFYDRYGGRGLVVLAVSTDAQPQLVRPFLEKMNLSLPTYLMDPDDERKLGIASIPTTYLIDSQGRVIRGQSGYSRRFETDWAPLIEQALPKPEGGTSPARGGHE